MKSHPSVRVPVLIFKSAKGLSRYGLDYDPGGDHSSEVTVGNTARPGTQAPRAAAGGQELVSQGPWVAGVCTLLTGVLHTVSEGTGEGFHQCPSWCRGEEGSGSLWQGTHGSPHRQPAALQEHWGTTPPRTGYPQKTGVTDNTAGGGGGPIPHNQTASTG